VESHIHEQLRLLHRISDIVSSNLTLEQMLEELVRSTVTATDSDACLVYLVDHPTGEIVLCASQLPHPSELGKIRLKMGEGITGWVAQHRSVVALAANATSDPRFKSFQALPEDTYEAFLSVPLISCGELIGVINIHHREKHAHTPDEIAAARFIGEQMGSAIAKSKLAERSLLASKRIEALAGLVRTISYKNHPNQILQAISETVVVVLSSHFCSIRLADGISHGLDASAWRCSAPDYLRNMPLKNDDSVGRVIPERRAVISPTLRTRRTNIRNSRELRD
jgi:uroporphyrinogen-III synthase